LGYDVNGKNTPLKLPVQYGVPMLLHAFGALSTMALIGQHDQKEIANEALGVMLANHVPIGNVDPQTLHENYMREGINGVHRTLVTGFAPSLVSPAVGSAVNRGPFGQQVFSEPQISPSDPNSNPTLAASPYRNTDGSVSGRTNTGDGYKWLAEMFAQAGKAGLPGVSALNLDSPESVQNLTKGYTPGILSGIAEASRDLVMIATRGAQDPNYDAAQSLVQEFAPLVKYANDELYYEGSKFNSVNLKYSALDRERAGYAPRDRTAFVGKRRPDGYIGPLEQAWRDENPEWKALKTTLDAGRKEIGALNKAIDAARKAEGPNMNQEVYGLRTQINGVYVKYNEEFDKILKSFGRDAKP
jgi:hypothetical protein